MKDHQEKDLKKYTFVLFDENGPHFYFLTLCGRIYYSHFLPVDRKGDAYWPSLVRSFT